MTTAPRYLVAVDGSDPADRALDWTIDHARRVGGTVDVVTVLDLGHVYAYQGLGVPELPIRQWQEELKQTVLDRALVKVIDAEVASRLITTQDPLPVAF